MSTDRLPGGGATQEDLGLLDSKRLITKLPEYTIQQLLRPWDVIHEDLEMDPEVTADWGKQQLELLKEAYIAPGTNFQEAIFMVNLNGLSPLYPNETEPRRTLWELRFRRGESGQIEEVQASTGNDLQVLNINPGINKITYFGHHTVLDPETDQPKKVASQKKNHPLWVSYGISIVGNLLTASLTEE